MRRLPNLNSAFGGGSVFCYVDNETLIGVDEYGALKMFQQLEDQPMSRIDFGRLSKQGIDNLIELLERMKTHVRN